LSAAHFAPRALPRFMGTSNNTPNWRFERCLRTEVQRLCLGGAGLGPFSRLARHRGGILGDAARTPPTRSAQAGAAAIRSS